jgi:hypothetical protein
MELAIEFEQREAQQKSERISVRQNVIVTTSRGRSVGYRDPRGIWRSTVTGQPIRNVLTWNALVSQ